MKNGRAPRGVPAFLLVIGTVIFLAPARFFDDPASHFFIRLIQCSMNILTGLVNATFRTLLRITCKLDISELKKVPAHGPMIIIVNHVSNIEGPLLYTFMRPRRTIALGKVELWERLFTRKLMQWWEVIPVNRGETDMQAMKQCFDVLDKGDFLCIAPEGTRSNKAKLLQAKSGTSFIALKKRVPILPIAHYGLEDFSRNIKRLKRTPVIVRVGKPFELVLEKNRYTSDERQVMVDEMMRRIACMLPEQYRGYYSDSIDDPFVFTREVDTPHE